MGESEIDVIPWKFADVRAKAEIQNASQFGQIQHGVIRFAVAFEYPNTQRMKSK